jgi:hypothetical protein
MKPTWKICDNCESYGELAALDICLEKQELAKIDRQFNDMEVLTKWILVNAGF